MLNDKLYVLWWRICNPYDIANYGVARQPPDHTAQTRSHGTNQVTRDKSGTKRDLQAPHGGPGYGVTVHISSNIGSFYKPIFALKPWNQDGRFDHHKSHKQIENIFYKI